MAEPKTFEPAWYVEAKRWIGTKEIKGVKHNQSIMNWISYLGPKALGIKVTDDETAWCGTFVAYCMKRSGLDTAAIAVRASSWLKYGRQLLAPRLGCIMVFTRTGGGHVGFYVGEDKTHYHILGGNQSDSVNVMRMAKDRLSPGGMRWPNGVELPPAQPVIRDPGNLKVSTNEA